MARDEDNAKYLCASRSRNIECVAAMAHAASELDVEVRVNLTCAMRKQPGIGFVDDGRSIDWNHWLANDADIHEGDHRDLQLLPEYVSGICLSGKEVQDATTRLRHVVAALREEQ